MEEVELIKRHPGVAPLMSWQSLPPELLVHVVVHLALPRLRRLKAVSRATANACRRTLRSDEWRSDENLDAMDAELKTKIDYKLPMTVCIFPAALKHKCLATIYELKLLRTDSDGAYIDLRKRRNWCVIPDDDSTQTLVGAMCIEVHGEGIAGSEHALRTMLQSVLRERGTCQHSNKLADTLTSDYVKFGADAQEKMSLHALLGEICPVTEVQKGRWEVHDSPSHEYSMSVWEMCAMGLDLFV